MNDKKNARKAGKPAAAKAPKLSAPARNPLALQTLEPQPEKTATAPQPTRKPLLAEALTLVEAKIDIGFGNALFIRGRGNGLSWDKGQPLTCVDPSTWAWSTNRAQHKVVFKLLLNDQVWCRGDNLVVEAGRKIVVTPGF